MALTRVSDSVSYSFDSIAELKTVEGIANQIAAVSGYYVAGDTSLPLYRWNATSTATDDGGSVHQVTGVTTGRWEAIIDGAVNVKWFGAKGDGVTNDDTALTNVEAATTDKIYLPTGTYVTTNNIDIKDYYGEGLFSIGGVTTSVPKTKEFIDQFNSSIASFFSGDNSLNLDVNQAKSEITIRLNKADTSTNYDWSLREGTFVWYHSTQTWYFLVDAVPLAPNWAGSTAYSLNDVVNNSGNMYVCTTAGTSAASGGPTGTGTGITDGTCVWDYVFAYHHPNSYDTEIHLFKSTDTEELATWTYVGVAIEKGGSGELGEFGVATPSGAYNDDGTIYCPFSARNLGAPTFGNRSIGLAYSSTPETLPWTKLSSAIVDTVGEDDDPAVLKLPNDPRLHVYFRTNNNGSGNYEIQHSSSATPKTASTWSSPNTAVPLFDGTVTAIETTSAFWLNGQVHIMAMEQVSGTKSAHWLSTDPDIEFVPANRESRHLLDTEIYGGNGSLAYGGHFAPAIRDGKIRGIFWTKTDTSPRTSRFGNLVNDSLRLKTPRTIGAFRATPNAPQSLAASTGTKVGFVDTTATAYDNEGWFISSRYTPQVEGYYEFETFVQLTAIDANVRVLLELQKNGSRYSNFDIVHSSTTTAIGIGGTIGGVYMNGSTDYVEVWISQESAGAKNVSGDHTSSFFSGRLTGV